MIESAKLLLSVIAVLLGGFIMFPPQVEAKPSVKKAAFGKTSDGRKIDVLILRNSIGAEARIITYGGALVSLTVPDKYGKFGDVVLGFDTVAAYEKQQSYIGALIGRYANRIARGRFMVDGREFRLATNNGQNHLHGGLKGFDKVVWNGREFVSETDAGVELSYLSPDGEEGYPGNLSVIIRYVLTDNNELKVVYAATTNKPTVVNLTQHAYFNLKGAGNGTILDHELTINADKFTPTDDGSIPTGELRSVKDTPFDFLRPTTIGARINQNEEQLISGKGYDHNWILNKKGKSVTLAATVFEPTSGRVFEVLTTEPGLQFYSGNYLDGAVAGKNGQNYPKHGGFCLEAQNYPDSPNKPNFPSAVLKEGETYSQTTIYRFSARK